MTKILDRQTFLKLETSINYYIGACGKNSCIKHQ